MVIGLNEDFMRVAAGLNTSTAAKYQQLLTNPNKLTAMQHAIDTRKMANNLEKSCLELDNISSLQDTLTAINSSYVTPTSKIQAASKSLTSFEDSLKLLHPNLQDTIRASITSPLQTPVAKMLSARSLRRPGSMSPGDIATTSTTMASFRKAMAPTKSSESMLDLAYGGQLNRSNQKVSAAMEALSTTTQFTRDLGVTSTSDVETELDIAVLPTGFIYDKKESHWRAAELWFYDQVAYYILEGSEGWPDEIRDWAWQLRVRASTSEKLEAFKELITTTMITGGEYWQKLDEHLQRLGPIYRMYQLIKSIQIIWKYSPFL
jgi:hypothetical protein